MTVAPRRILFLIWLLGGLGLLLPGACACNVPVFRYALERWPAQNFDVIVFHRGALEPEDQAVVETIHNSNRQSFANVRAQTVDVSDPMDEPLQKLWQQQKDPALPWMVVRAPESGLTAPSVWAGRLQAERVQALLDSPARRRIAERLLQGESAVWVLLESGDSMEDELILDRLSEELKRQEQTLELPPPAADDPPLRAELPLRVSFSLVRVTRRDAAEEMFVHLLLHGDKKLADCTQPIAFPIFGRGRVLAGFAASELRRPTIAGACAFITGACSCEAKELNPGKDLLLAANWNSIFKSPPPESKPSVPAPMIPPAPKPVAIAAEKVTELPGGPTMPPPKLLIAAIGLTALLVVVTGAMALRSRSRK